MKLTLFVLEEKKIFKTSREYQEEKKFVLKYLEGNLEEILKKIFQKWFFNFTKTENFDAWTISKRIVSENEMNQTNAAIYDTEWCDTRNRDYAIMI